MITDFNLYERYDGDTDKLNLFKQIKYNNLSYIKKYIQDNPDKINIQNSNKFTLLIEAVHKNKNDIVDYLLSTDIDINIQDKYGMTALIKAANVNNEYAIKVLLDVGAKVNIIDKRKDNALFKAYKNNNFNNCELLINNGIDLTVKNTFGETVLTSFSNLYELRDRIDIIKLLLLNGANPFTKTLGGHDFFSFIIDNHFILPMIKKEFPELYKKYNIKKLKNKYNI